MLNRIIDFTLAYRWLVLVGILILLAGGGYALYTIPVEAFPDLTNNQVVVVTDAPSLPPSEVEQLVTELLVWTVTWDVWPRRRLASRIRATRTWIRDLLRASPSLKAAIPALLIERYLDRIGNSFLAALHAP